MKATDVLGRIREKRAEEARLLAILDLWAAVQAQGIDIGSVACFGMDPRFLTKRERLERQQAARLGQPDPIGERSRPTVFNYVRHRDGRTTRLHPSLKAVP
jgi:hypothetical protein